MFEFVCPKCRTANEAAKVQAGQVVACGGCSHPLRVTSAGGFKKGGSPALAATLGGLLGLAGAAVLVVAWLLCRPAPAVTRVAIEPIAEWRQKEPAARPEEKRPETESAKRPEEKRPETKPAKRPADPDEKAATPPAESETKPVSAPVATAERVGLTGQQISARLLKSICWIVSEGKQDGKTVRWTGSGTLVDHDKRLVVTNEHVANKKDSSRVTVFFPIKRGNKLLTENRDYWAEYEAGRGIKAEVVWEDVARDLAVLKLEKLPRDEVVAIRLAGREVESGQAIHTRGGSPNGNQGQWIYSSGVVRQVSPHEWNYGKEDPRPRRARVIASTVPINGGDSGGGVVNDRCQLVGVNNMKSRGDANSGHISLPEVTTVLQAYYKEIGRDWTPPTEDTEPEVAAKDVSGPVGDLQAPDKETRLKAASVLRDLGREARKAIPALLAVACNPAQADEVHEAAVAALEDIGAPGPDEFAVVVETVRSSAPVDVRRYAIGALEPLAARRTDAANALLITALSREKKDAAVREAAIASLAGVTGKTRDTVRRRLLDLLSDPEKSIRRRAYATLTGFDFPDPDAVNIDEQRKNFLDDKATSESRRYSCHLLTLSKQNEIPTVCGLLKPDAEPELATTILWTLRYHKDAKSREAEQGLSRALDHPDAGVRRMASSTLTHIGYDVALFPAFLKAAGSADYHIWGGPLQTLSAAHTTWSTFDKREVQKLDLAKDSLDSIRAALEGKDEMARKLAAFALGTMKAEGAGGARALRVALKKEAKTAARLEMLTAFARIGPAALDSLSNEGDATLDELAALVREERSDDLKTCAALALVSIAPATSAHYKSALRELAKAILLKNAPGAVRPAPRPTGRPGQRDLRAARDPEPKRPATPEEVKRQQEEERKREERQQEEERKREVELELHERAKLALKKGGRDAAQELAKVCLTSFFQRGAAEGPGVAGDKRHARKVTCQILAAIGPAANGPSVKKLAGEFAKYINTPRGPQEYPEVIDAFNEMVAAIKNK